MNQTKVLINLVIILLITGAILYGFFGVSEENRLKLKLGLDLRSGTHITLQLKESVDPVTGEVTKIDQPTVNTTIKVFTKRLNAIGTSEIMIAQAGKDRIIIEIPEMTDLDKAKNMVRKAGRLEFKEKKFDPVTQTAQYKTVMDGRYLKSASVAPAGGSDNWCVDFQLNDEGTRIFGELTSRLVQKPLGIFFDGVMHSEPIVQTPITGGAGQITGNFTLEEANDLANILNSGALTIDVEILEAYTVSPTLGEQSLRSSLTAGVIGLIAVILYMIAYYRLPGFLASIALVIYGVWVVGSMVISAPFTSTPCSSRPRLTAIRSVGAV